MNNDQNKPEATAAPYIDRSGVYNAPIENIPLEAVDVPDKEKTEEIGRTGSIIVSGLLSNNDYNNDLTGTKRIAIYDQMRLSDATVRAALLAVKLPILSADWFIKDPKSEKIKKNLQVKMKQTAKAHADNVQALNQQPTKLDTNGLPIPIQTPPAPDTTMPNVEMSDEAKFIETQLFYNPNFSWTATLRQIMTFIDYGSSYFEKVFAVTSDGKIGWLRFGQRLPGTIYRYSLQDGLTPGITQILPTGGVAEIPEWKLLYFVNEMEGSNFEGISFLRAAYKHWFYKETYYKIDAIATERMGLGIPILKPPPQASPKDKTTARNIAKNIRANEQAYGELPPGWNMEFMDNKAEHLKSPKDMIMHHDRQIVKAMLAQFLELGSTSTGSFALSSNQSQLFLLGLDYVAKLIQEQLNRAIRELIDLNFPNVAEEDYPELEYSNIGQVDVDKMAQALQRLAQGGLITADEELERYIRTLLKLPEATRSSEDDHTDVQDQQVPVPNIKLNAQPPKVVAKETQLETLKASDFIADMYTLRKEIDDALTAKPEQVQPATT